MTNKEKILRSLATLASVLIIFAGILAIGAGPISGETWGIKSFMVATGFSIFSAMFWWSPKLNIFKG